VFVRVTDDDFEVETAIDDAERAAHEQLGFIHAGQAHDARHEVRTLLFNWLMEHRRDWLRNWVGNARFDHLFGAP
jgi:hypothetical protein